MIEHLSKIKNTKYIAILAYLSIRKQSYINNIQNHLNEIGFETTIHTLRPMLTTLVNQGYLIRTIEKREKNNKRNDYRFPRISKYTFVSDSIDIEEFYFYLSGGGKK